MKGHNQAILFFTLFILHFLVAAAKAEPVNQSFTLHPGWNAIFLEVEPDSTDPTDVFTGITDLQSVWKWNTRSGTVEFIQNPNLLVPDEPQMLVYIPGNPVVTNLYAINGNSAYLVQLGGSVDVPLMVTGEPKIPRHEWKSNSFNFVGFHLTEGAEPFFSNFFASSPAHTDQDIYILNNATDSWELVTSPTVQMRQGEGFWVYCNGSSTFNGSVSVQLEQSSGLHYGTVLSEQELFLHNNGSVDKNITLSLPALQGVVHYWVFDEVDGVPSWEPLPATLVLPVRVGEAQRVRLGVRRVGLTEDLVYETNVGVTDSAGISFQMPLSVTGIGYSGLWTGYTTVTKVSDQNKVVDNSQDTTPLPTGSEFDFRLIVHAEDGGTVRMLSQVIQMWQEGTWKPDPNNLGRFIVDEPGSFVLLIDDSLIGNYSGASLRDGQPVGRRISAPVFPRLTAAQAVMGGNAAGSAFNPAIGNYLDKSIILARDNPTNPFRHLFHPGHKNLDQSYEVVRDITLTFADEDNDGNPITGLPALGWGSSELGGIYTEEITGLHNRHIFIQGTFVLHRVSDVAILTQ